MIFVASIGIPLIKRTIILACHFIPAILHCQADNEIQVYASPTIGKNRTIIELHSNHTFRGNALLADQKQARWTFETLEITHGLSENFELGFYTFAGFSPSGTFQYLGNQIRPRVTMPADLEFPVGMSLSAEFGFYRPSDTSAFSWQGELRPIIDRTDGPFYFALNPNFDLAFDRSVPVFGITPQVKMVYTILQKFGVGFEYYSVLGNTRGLFAVNEQEHLLGPMFDLYSDPDLELNTGLLFGLTPGSNQVIFKLLLGKRFNW